MPDRVRDEVAEYFADPDGVDIGQRNVVVDLRSEADSGRVGCGRERHRDLRTEHVQVGRLAVERERAGFAESEGPEVLDEPAQHPGLLEDRVEVGLVRGMDPVEDRLDVAGDDRERRPQLVRDIGEQAPALGLVGLEPRGHRVEAADEVANGPRRGARNVDPGAVVAGLDPRRLIDELVQDVARAADRRAGADDRADHDDRHEERREADDMTGDAGRGHDPADDAGRDRDQPEDADHEQEAEEAAEAPPWPWPTAGRPALVGGPPRGPLPGPRRTPPRVPPAGRTAAHGRSSAKR